MAIDKEELLKKRLAARDFEIEGVGTVRIRSLTRAELLEIKGEELPMVVMDRKLIAASMVDPALTEDEVRQWQENSSPSELEPLTEAIMRLSGLAKEAPKEAYKEFPSEPGS